jgi:hypothetical protein
VEEPDIAALVAELQARVARRRADGDYPPGMEAQLEAEFERVVRGAIRDETDTAELGRLVAAVGLSAAGINAEPDLGSRVPGGALFHRSAARVVGRHTRHLAAGVRVLADDVAASLREVERVAAAQRSADERQLLDVLAAVLDRLAVLDHIGAALLDLERRVGIIEQQHSPPS